jgi:hypothetical protein
MGLCARRVLPRLIDLAMRNAAFRAERARFVLYKLTWRPLGTVWARNLTPDRETGLGAWTDDEIARAIRGGIAKGGRPLHWQAMIWDHASTGTRKTYGR